MTAASAIARPRRPGECPTEQLPKNPISSSPYPCQRGLPKDFPGPGGASPGRFEEGWKSRTFVVNYRKSITI